MCRRGLPVAQQQLNAPCQDVLVLLWNNSLLKTNTEMPHFTAMPSHKLCVSECVCVCVCVCVCEKSGN